MLLDLVRAHAALMQHQRERVESAGMIQILATVDDFRQACRLYTALNGSSGGQQTKLTKKESDLVEAIRRHGQGEITIAEMQHITGRSNSVIYKMLHGSCSHGTNYTGLLEKCPALSVCDRTLVSDEGGMSAAHRRSKAYSWDSYVYDSWACDGGCWLEGYGSDTKTDEEDLPPSGSEPSRGIAECRGILAEISAKSKGTDKAGKKKQKKNKNNNNLSSTSRGNSESMKQEISDPVLSEVSVTEISFSAKRDPVIQSTTPDSCDGESEPVECCGNFRELSAKSDDIPQDDRADVQDKKSGSLTVGEINPREFTEIIQGFGPGPCDCCGSMWVNYQERMSRDRLTARPVVLQRICSRCYDKARKKDADSFRTLPGILNPTVMRRMTVDLGRCYLCDSQKAVWYDPEMKMAICEICYQNIVSDSERTGLHDSD